ncbi:hypothetical protein N7456_009180 [Penicillium angulare]|uniref:Mitochondrial distribution and morphology protein 34 n=1 Tax=Penicillium angulare TaxID=116970 RepID=A0A9W9F4D9_9EURO|nr:hypothetical protein N7456_009180 [Penicillium angulare]
MAFNFNWSPLMADAGFYTRAQELLTAALNKSPKPPIIVDDIIVTELNLGSMPPDLEILEIGDLAEDRFRGIFKMSYSGDAFLTLKTRVQANPLNTYLITRPSFASPKPLAAATPLTIPLQITLSDFKLSGFVILVFSKQKGITVVFRNDPLESLKVSSTFDSIPFVRDFLQKAIEAQLRILFMDELPAIIHRLSLRLWVPEYRAGEDAQNESENTDKTTSEGPGQDPLASPPQDPVDSLGNALNETEIASLSLDSSVETHSLFSQKNLLRLAALTDSQRTLSLFTPSITEVVYRAWTSPSDPSEFPASVLSPLSPALSRTHSQVGSMASSIHESGSTVSLQSRPSLSSHSLSSYGLSLGAGRHSKANSRRRKKRVVDLRRPKTTDDAMSVSDDGTHTESTSPPSIASAPLPIVNEQSDDPVTPPLSPETDSHLPTIPERHRTSLSRPADMAYEKGEPSYLHETIRPSKFPDFDATPRPLRNNSQNEKAEASSSSAARQSLPATILPFTEKDEESKGPVDPLLVERLAGEIARRMREEKLMSTNACSNFWTRGQDDTPPPAYGH